MSDLEITGIRYLGKRETTYIDLARPRVRDSEDIVNVNVSRGNDKNTFLVYKRVICHYSPFFDAAFNGPFLEGERQAINMDECSPAGFALFVNWMYSPSHDIKPDRSLSSKKATEALVELWLLADRCLVSGLQNQVLMALDQVRERTRYRMASSSAVIYENTSDDSPLRRYLVEVIASSATIEDMGTMAGMPWEMLVDIIALLKAERGYRRWVHFTPQQLSLFFVKERKNKGWSGRRAKEPQKPTIFDLVSDSD